MSQDVNLGHVVGQGVPSGGTAGQILKKNGSTNFDTSWTTLDGSMVPVSAGDSTTVQQSLAAVKSDMGIVEDGNTATHTIAAGQYVIWKGALYTASAAIPAGTTLSTSNLTAVSGGGLNALNGKIANVATDVANSAFCAMGASGSGATSASITLPVGALFDSLHPIFVISIYRSNATDANEGYGIMKIDGSSVYITRKTGLENVTDATYNSTTRVLTFTCGAYRTFLVFGQRTSH